MNSNLMEPVVATPVVDEVNGTKIPTAFPAAVYAQSSMHMHRMFTGSQFPTQEERQPSHIAKKSIWMVVLALLIAILPAFCLYYGYSYDENNDLCEKFAKYLIVAGWTGLLFSLQILNTILQGARHVTNFEQQDISDSAGCAGCLVCLVGVFSFAWLIYGMCLLFGSDGFGDCPLQQTVCLKVYIGLNLFAPIAICCAGCLGARTS